MVYDKAIDRGLEGVVACRTHISSIRDATLRYRGYKIEDLAQHCCFEDVVHLLWYGKLPHKSRNKYFKKIFQATCNYLLKSLEF